ncbi:DUF1015 domain-containing protein [Anaerofilum sp. BX8]|uniref:DUF1015 domain-containing protein n=1 Tax=Anaerofilum hominis TaxID=2763016 RepID=A0A923L279_9FIRM|nr:DUF1015 domain-containing protein [Anaerofilum hominis]MBC5582515.1 DUF1015 domain-containing protein [Anaerofilum hominis]
MKKHRIVEPAEILLPRADTDLEKWACLACDQFTSQPEYWQQAEALAGDSPSCLDLVLPEVYLDQPGVEARIENIHRAMRDALAHTLTRRVQGFVYVRRTTGSGVREGLVAAVDLEQYSYTKGAQPLIRPTENTVESRIPPRLAVRRGAALETPHILMLVDDPQNTLLGPLAAAREKLPLLYDTPLMLGGGRIEGRAVTDPVLVESVVAAAEAFAVRPGPGGRSPIAIAVGDGNHSLATAKAWWEEVKAGLSPAQAEGHPARYCLVELENIHDPAILVEPIHRVVFGVPEDAFTDAMQRFFAARGAALTRPGSAGDACQRFTLVTADGDRHYAVQNPAWPLCVGSLEAFLSDYLPAHPAARVDYIHGEAAVRGLAGRGALGLLLPPFEKEDLFRGVYLGGVLPKKTFSMGHAEEKRYYLECRRITP